MTQFNPDGSHPREKETYEYIASWANSIVPFSLKDEWGRYGALGVLAHLFLSGLRDTHILEIGVGESSIYLSEVARRLNRNFYTCDIAEGKITNPLSVKGYLLEGLHLMTSGSTSSSSQYPFRGVAYVGASDDFFVDERIKFPSIGFAFIDGDHNYAQAKKDFDNTLNVLADDGVICLHDTYPPTEEYTSEHRCGDVYKLRQELEKREDLDVFTFNRLLACDVGLTMARKKPQKRAYYNE